MNASASAETSDELRKRIAQDLALLRRLREELRMRTHLLTASAKDEWRVLEPKVLDAELAIERLTQEAYDEVRMLVRKLDKLLWNIG